MNAAHDGRHYSNSAAVADTITSARKRVIIIGGGFAGVAAAKALRHADAEVVLIDRRNHHLFQPLLYQVATAIISPAEIAAPLRQMEVSHRNLTVLLGEVTNVSLNDRTVDAVLPGSGLRRIAFDFVVVATGAQPNYFGHDEFAKHAPSLKTVGDAEAMRARILRAFEIAETTEDETERARQMTFVLVGAGPTGVELAASFAQMVKTTLRGNFRHIDPAAARIFLIDGAERVLPMFGQAVSRIVTTRLEKLGVEILTGLTVQHVDEQGVIAGTSQINCATVLWTAGVSASPLVKTLKTETDRAGRALVDAFLGIAGAEGVFVVGDAASVKEGEHMVPGLAQAAIQEGRYVGKLIAKALKGEGIKQPFRYFNKGQMAEVGKNFAVLERSSLHTKGFLTWLVWAVVHILALPQMQNRLRVQRQWLWCYITGQRGSRIIPETPQGTDGS